MDAFWSAVNAPVVTANVAEVADGATITEAGALKVLVLLDSAIEAPPAGAALLKLIVQLPEALGPRLTGLQESDDIKADGTSPIALLAELAPTVAANVTVRVLVIAPVVAVNTADNAPALTVTVGGTVTALLVLEIETSVPPEGAAVERVTVQLVEAFAPRLEGVQESDETKTFAPRPITTLAELTPTVAVSIAL